MESEGEEIQGSFSLNESSTTQQFMVTSEDGIPYMLIDIKHSCSGVGFQRYYLRTLQTVGVRMKDIMSF